jgi:hypothetical protein
MADDRSITAANVAAIVDHRSRRRSQLVAVDPVVASLRRAYAETLAEPLPPALASLLSRLE